MKNTVRFVHLTDTHIGPNKSAEVSFTTPYPKARAVVERIKSLPFKVDFIAHTGDIVYDPDDQAYALAQELFSEIPAPFYYVAGNHDSSSSIWTQLAMPDVERPFPKEDWLCYSFSKGDTQFVTLDAQCTTPWVGTLPEQQIDFLKSKAHDPNQSLVVFIHYPPFQIDNPWANSCMLLTNPEPMHETLLHSKSRVAGVFHGHIHRILTHIRDGILYSSTTATASEFMLSPGTSELCIDDIHVPGFQVVSITNGNTILKHYPCPLASS